MEEQGADHSDTEECQKPMEEQSDEKMECEEVLSGTDSIEMTEEKTDSSDKVTGADDKMVQLSPMLSDDTSGIGMKYGSTTSPSDIRSAVETPAPDSAVGTPAGSSAASELSPPAKAKGGILQRTWKFIKSPIKKDSTSPKDTTTSPKSKSRNLFGFKGKKSMSPPERPQESADERLEPVGGACSEVPGNQEESFKKGGEKKKTLSKFISDTIRAMSKKGSSTSDTEGLVPNQEDAGAESVSSPTEALGENEPVERADDDEIYKRPQWTDGRQSLTSRPSISVTQTTDAPSLSDSEVFPLDDSRRPSGAGENTSEEAVVGSLASSSDDPVPEIQMDKAAESLVTGTPVKREAEDVDGVQLESGEVACSPRKKPYRAETDKVDKDSSTDTGDEEPEIAEDH